MIILNAYSILNATLGRINVMGTNTSQNSVEYLNYSHTIWHTEIDPSSYLLLNKKASSLSLHVQSVPEHYSICFLHLPVST